MNRFRSLSLFSLLIFLVIGGQALLAASSNPISTRLAEPASTSDAAWTDSLQMSTAGRGEHDLQYYLDSLGYDIDVVNDELGSVVFCGLDGVNTATLVIEVAGSAVWATSGYYEAGDPTPLYQLFGPTNVPGDSASFTFDTFDSIGFYMSPNLPGATDTWFTEQSLNDDSYDHAWVFSTGDPHEFLICFEDLPDGGDEDFQDLVIKIHFANDAPEITLPDDYTVILCGPEAICFDVTAIDPNCGADSLWLEMTSGEGTFTPLAGVSEINASHCFTPSVAGIYSFTFESEDILGAISTETLNINVVLASAPVVTIADSSLALCEPEEICLPVTIIDPDCDVVSISTNFGSYTGTMANFDQVMRLNQLGGSVTQIGGGDPGKVLYSADDYVAPVNSQSGVTVTLPNFVHADHVVHYGSFPTGSEPGNSADHMLGAPTDLTFTAPGAGGPDGGDGDGSVLFDAGNRCVLGFPEDITTCHGANADLVVFTNTGGSGNGKLYFRKNGSTVHTMTMTIPNGSSSSGIGGITLDLPDGLTFNQIKIKCLSGAFEIDALACRTAPSSTDADVCFMADTAGIYEIIITAIDSCGNVGVDTALVTVTMNAAPVADAGSDFGQFMCGFD